jgi:hypothetical protein
MIMIENFSIVVLAVCVSMRYSVVVARPEMNVFKNFNSIMPYYYATVLYPP